MKEDHHIHTQFCPHGSNASMEDYVKYAINKRVESITFTEHAPLPVEDPVSNKDSAMRAQDVYEYLKEAKGLQSRYGHDIDINVGFEIDYIEGYEEETLSFLEKHPETIPYSILSVHFLKMPNNTYFCIDYSKYSFLEKAEKEGISTLYSLYEKTLEKALNIPYGELTPKKIGHMNLIHKFSRAYEYEDPIDWLSLLKRAKKNDYKLDYNFSGIDKEFYRLTYPNDELVKDAITLGLVLETGSDAHNPKDVGRYFT